MPVAVGVVAAGRPDQSLAYIVASNAGTAIPRHWVPTGNEKVDLDSLATGRAIQPGSVTFLMRG